MSGRGETIEFPAKWSMRFDAFSDDDDDDLTILFALNKEITNGDKYFNRVPSVVRRQANRMLANERLYL